MCQEARASSVFTIQLNTESTPRKKKPEDRRHDDHHDNGHAGFTPRGPRNLRRFGPDLPDEFAWAGFSHEPAFRPSKLVSTTGPQPEKPANVEP